MAAVHAYTECRACGELGHLAHYCPNRNGYVSSKENEEWLSCVKQKAQDAIVQDLGALIRNQGWISRVRLLCKLCAQNPSLLSAANTLRSEDGLSILAIAMKNKLRNTVRLLWNSGITCGIDPSEKDNFFVLMKLFDVAHNDNEYDWFTGKSEIAARLEREGGMIDAEVRVSLMWNCTDDLDLHVICPSGEEINYQHKTSRCGGNLDVDINASDPYSQVPVENVVWAPGNAPAGRYQVIVNNYCHRSRSRNVPYTVEIAIQGRPVEHINGVWAVDDGEGNRAQVKSFDYDPSAEAEPAGAAEEEAVYAAKSEPIVPNINKLADMNSPDRFALAVWLALRQREPALVEMLITLGLHDPQQKLGKARTCVSPQWCFLQAIWAKNLQAAQMLQDTCGKEIDINHKYRWDVIPWDESVAQMCWRECHGNEMRDRPWLVALAWLASEGADFSEVKLSFHRWRKPPSMQESQIRTFDRLIWHLSDENGWKSNSQAGKAYLVSVVRKLARWGAHIPEDLDPNFDGGVEWGVNGKRPANAASFCYGSLDVELVQEAVRQGKSRNQDQVIAALCAMSRACPKLHSSTKRSVLTYLYPGLGRGSLSYATLQKSEGGRVVTANDEPVCISEDIAPPRGYVCGRCKQAGHWRQFCPRRQ